MSAQFQHNSAQFRAIPYSANTCMIYHILQPINRRLARHVQIGVFSPGNLLLSAPNQAETSASLFCTHPNCLCQTNSGFPSTQLVRTICTVQCLDIEIRNHLVLIAFVQQKPFPFFGMHLECWVMLLLKFNSKVKLFSWTLCNFHCFYNPSILFWEEACACAFCKITIKFALLCKVSTT